MKSSMPSTNPRSTFRPKYALLPSIPTGNSASKSSGNAGAGLSASDILGAYGRAGVAGHHDGGDYAPLSRRPRTAGSSDTCSAFGGSISVAPPTSLPCAGAGSARGAAAESVEVTLGVGRRAGGGPLVGGRGLAGPAEAAK